MCFVRINVHKYYIVATADVTYSCVLIIRKNLYIINNEFDSAFKIVAFT